MMTFGRAIVVGTVGGLVAGVVSYTVLSESTLGRGRVMEFGMYGWSEYGADDDCPEFVGLDGWVTVRDRQGYGVVRGVVDLELRTGSKDGGEGEALLCRTRHVLDGSETRIFAPYFADGGLLYVAGWEIDWEAHLVEECGADWGEYVFARVALTAENGQRFEGSATVRPPSRECGGAPLFLPGWEDVVPGQSLTAGVGAECKQAPLPGLLKCKACRSASMLFPCVELTVDGPTARVLWASAEFPRLDREQRETLAELVETFGPPDDVGTARFDDGTPLNHWQCWEPRDGVTLQIIERMWDCQGAQCVMLARPDRPTITLSPGPCLRGGRGSVRE